MPGVPGLGGAPPATWVDGGVVGGRASNTSMT
eukprot:COSAG04_NODE_16919_length_485_cov_0.826425_1_plen_31_part_01